jgi:hypothetical protein
VLLSTSCGSCAHFELAGGQTCAAVVHSTVEEIWYFLSTYPREARRDWRQPTATVTL